MPSLEEIDQRWKRIATEGPLAVMPIQAAFSEDGIPVCFGTVYAGQYPSEPFDSLWEFALYHIYVSSMQQAQFQTGQSDMEWFEDMDFESDRFLSEWERGKKKDGKDLLRWIKQLELPEEMNWIKEMSFEEGIIQWGADTLELVAKAKEGYLCLFVVDDEGLDPDENDPSILDVDDIEDEDEGLV